MNKKIKILEHMIRQEVKRCLIEERVSASKYLQYIQMADIYGWENVFDVLENAGYDTMSYRVSSIPSTGSPSVDLKTTKPKMKDDVVVEKVYEDKKDGGIIVKTNKAFLKFWYNKLNWQYWSLIE